MVGACVLCQQEISGRAAKEKFENPGELLPSTLMVSLEPKAFGGSEGIVRLPGFGALVLDTWHFRHQLSNYEISICSKQVWWVVAKDGRELGQRYHSKTCQKCSSIKHLDCCPVANYTTEIGDTWLGPFVGLHLRGEECLGVREQQMGSLLSSLGARSFLKTPKWCLGFQPEVRSPLQDSAISFSCICRLVCGHKIAPRQATIPSSVASHLHIPSLQDGDSNSGPPGWVVVWIPVHTRHGLHKSTLLGLPGLARLVILVLCCAACLLSCS